MKDIWESNTYEGLQLASRQLIYVFYLSIGYLINASCMKYELM